jgi:hypothetical protein
MEQENTSRKTILKIIYSVSVLFLLPIIVTLLFPSLYFSKYAFYAIIVGAPGLILLGSFMFFVFRKIHRKMGFVFFLIGVSLIMLTIIALQNEV